MEEAVKTLYQQLLAGWNRRDAAAMAALFTQEGSVVGFDGSQMQGPDEIQAQLAPIFADHPTAAYVSIVREVRALTPNVALLRADVGMVPPGQQTINPATNAIQSLIAVQEDETWGIALFQNTPAQFHGRPHLVEKMTRELQALVTS